MQIEVTDEMREAVKRVKEARLSLTEHRLHNSVVLDQLMSAYRQVTDLVLAAIEEQTAQEGA